VPNIFLRKHEALNITLHHYNLPQWNRHDAKARAISHTPEPTNLHVMHETLTKKVSKSPRIKQRCQIICIIPPMLKVICIFIVYPYPRSVGMHFDVNDGYSTDRFSSSIMQFFHSIKLNSYSHLDLIQSNQKYVYPSQENVWPDYLPIL
jgi:hypothetical protein